VKLSLPIWAQKPLLDLCRPPVSSTVIQAAISSQARAARHALRYELILAADQQPHQLPLRNADADRLQLRHQPKHGDLPLVISSQNKAP
jgi:hypothetical protein